MIRRNAILAGLALPFAWLRTPDNQMGPTTPPPEPDLTCLPPELLEEYELPPTCGIRDAFDFIEARTTEFLLNQLYEMLQAQQKTIQGLKEQVASLDSQLLAYRERDYPEGYVRNKTPSQNCYPGYKEKGG